MNWIPETKRHCTAINQRFYENVCQHVKPVKPKVPIKKERYFKFFYIFL